MVKYLDKNSGFNQWNASKSASDKKASKFSGFLWWFILFLAAWWLMGIWFGPKNQDTNTTTDVAVYEDISAVPVSNIASDNISANVQGLRISNIQLTNFTETSSDDAVQPVTLLADENTFAEIGLLASQTTAPSAKTVWKQDGNSYHWRNSDGVEFTRTITADGYVITVTDEIKNNTARDISFAPYARIVRGDATKSSATVASGAVAYVNSDIERSDWTDIDKKSYAYSSTNGFIGFADQYWETIVNLDSPDQTMRVKKQGAQYHADVASAAVNVAPKDTIKITTNLFAGPRDQDILNTAAQKIAGIDETIDYGWFWFLARPMLWALNALNAIVMNYGVAIIMLTLILRLLMWPLTRKSYTSMMAMQKMQPEMARIQKLYANDKARMQMEMMRLYQTHKTSPMSGCLPMLIQIPIFFALYKALLISVQMRSAHFLWISDLAAMDPYFILPILMGATMWWQQKLQTASNANATAGANDAVAQTQKVMKFMPLLFTVMFAWMPAGLVLYWTVSNLFGIAQMYIIRRRSAK